MAMSVLDDIKALRTYILGVIAFATAVATFLIQIWHFRAEPTIVATTGFAILVLALSLLIHRSEARQTKALSEHEDMSQEQAREIIASLEELKKLSVENQRSSLRIEMNDMIVRHPENHDTILRYAEQYFITLNGNFVQTDIFMNWVDSENEQGRKVHLNPELSKDITKKYIGK